MGGRLQDAWRYIWPEIWLRLEETGDTPLDIYPDLYVELAKAYRKAPQRRVSTTLRQVLTEFSERFSFPQGNFAPGSPSNDDRQLGRPTASPLFLFHLPLPTGSGSGVGTGLLIQTALGRTGGLGALRTKRSG